MLDHVDYSPLTLLRAYSAVYDVAVRRRGDSYYSIKHFNMHSDTEHAREANRLLWDMQQPAFYQWSNYTTVVISSTWFIFIKSHFIVSLSHRALYIYRVSRRSISLCIVIGRLHRVSWRCLADMRNIVPVVICGNCFSYRTMPPLLYSVYY